MVLGALILPGPLVSRAEQKLTQLLEHRRHTLEMKWQKVSRSKLDIYKDFAAFHFDHLVPEGAEFHALVVNCSALDHRKYNNGDPDLGFNKFLYQLLHHRVSKRFGHAEKLVVDLDARNSTREVQELQDVLNAGAARHFGNQRRPFTRVAHRCSKTTRLLQLSDLLSGAVAWHKNDHDALQSASESKIALATHIAQHAGLRRLGNDSPRAESRLGVWNFRMGGSHKGRPAV